MISGLYQFKLLTLVVTLNSVIEKDVQNIMFPLHLGKHLQTLPKKLIVFKPDLHAAIPQEMGQQSIKMPLDNLIWNLISKLTMLHT